jgi:hypothetical protein
MVTQREERVTISSYDSQGSSILIDRPTNYEVTTDITTPSEARIEMGDNGTWSQLRDAIAIGRKFRVSINDRPILAGRMLMRALPITPDGGATVQLTVRTVLADAAFTSCRTVNVHNATLKTIILEAYKTLGLTEGDFIFNADVARDLMTGRSKNTSSKVALEKLTEQDARVQPPETVYSFVDRHIRRHGLLHWDGPDGRVVVGKPNDAQIPIYALQCMRRSPRGNNVLTVQRSQDYEQVPAAINIWGQGGKHAYGSVPVNAAAMNAIMMQINQKTKALEGGKLDKEQRAALESAIEKLEDSYIAPPITSTLQDAVISRVAVNRQVAIIDESINTQALAEARARREMAQRSLNADSWEVKVAGWCYRDRNGRLVPWAVDTCSSLIVDTASPVSDSCYIWRVIRTGNPMEGHTSRLTLSARGVWVI